MRPSISSRTLALFAAAALLPLAASAHTGVDGGLHHGLVAGFMHPLTGADHLAAMVAVGVWSALSARRAWPDLLWAPLAFAGMLLAGALVGLAGLQLPAVEPMIAASLLVLGLLVVTRVHLPAAGRGARGAGRRCQRPLRHLPRLRDRRRGRAAAPRTRPAGG
uniref:HupE/UreJ family protein n=1 Tax=Variovorax paradoxus TaxID=34073 RepID=UPI001ABCC76F